jgi:hypothetical protein
MELATIALTEEPGNPNFQCVLNENEILEQFNPEEEDK